MFKTILIKILFALLKVDLRTQDIVPFDELKSIAGEQKANEITDKFRKEKYIRALAAAYHVQHFNEWLYLQVVTKRNEHIKTIDKDKRDAQRASMLTFLMIIEALRQANVDLVKMSKRK
jgi:hypothetical protein